MTIIQTLGNILNGIYRVLNVTIPGFHISIANILLGCFILTSIVGIIKMKEGK